MRSLTLLGLSINSLSGECASNVLLDADKIIGKKKYKVIKRTVMNTCK